VSGHNKWSSIKHKKGAADAKRGRLFTRLIKEITIAARLGGGDADGNPRLRRAIDAAKASNMPQDNVTRAIKKGTGELEGVDYEELTYEGVGPAGALFLIDAMTDNRNRTHPELRHLFEKHGGQLGSAGSAAWAFDDKGVIYIDRQQAGEEKLFEAAVGAGAEDVQDLGEDWMVRTELADLDAVAKTLEDAGISVKSAELARLPKTPKEVSGADAEALMNLSDALDDHDDVQKVWSDFELSEEALAALSAD
jgi:YebC/PmpR family DNA-binding regulatory protein